MLIKMAEKPTINSFLAVKINKIIMTCTVFPIYLEGTVCMTPIEVNLRVYQDSTCLEAVVSKMTNR